MKVWTIFINVRTHTPHQIINLAHFSLFLYFFYYFLKVTATLERQRNCSTFISL